MSATVFTTGAAAFRERYDRIRSIAADKLDQAKEQAATAGEAAAVEAFGPVGEPDIFMAPPAKPVIVRCMHCDDKYRSNEMRWEYRPHCQAAMVELLGEEVEKLSPMWWCRNVGCDGGGYGHDIHPVRRARKKLNVIVGVRCDG